LADGTRRAYRVDVEEFCSWLDERGTRLEAVDIRTLVDYVARLGSARRGGRLAPATIARKLAAVRAFLRHSLGAARVPDARLAPRRGRRLPDAPRRVAGEQGPAGCDGQRPVAPRDRP